MNQFQYRIMRIKEQTTYDLKTDKFRYLKRNEGVVLNRVDVNKLNERLNRTKKSEFYATFMFAILCLVIVITLAVVGIKF